MIETGMKLGLLSTAKDFDLVGETLRQMHLLPDSTEVVAITTAGNREGRGGNELADRALQALSHAGFIHVEELDVQGRRRAELAKKLTAVLPDGKERLVVLTGGDKHFLREHLKGSGADQIITRGVRRGQFAIVTISAGTANMGSTIDATWEDNRPTGLNLVPAVLVCHFDSERVQEIRTSVVRSRYHGQRIIGIGDNQALVGKSGTDLSVVGDGLVVDLERMSPMPYHSRSAKKRIRLYG